MTKKDLLVALCEILKQTGYEKTFCMAISAYITSDRYILSLQESINDLVLFLHRQKLKHATVNKTILLFFI